MGDRIQVEAGGGEAVGDGATRGGSGTSARVVAHRCVCDAAWCQCLSAARWRHQTHAAPARRHISAGGGISVWRVGLCVARAARGATVVLGVRHSGDATAWRRCSAHG